MQPNAGLVQQLLYVDQVTIHWVLEMDELVPKQAYLFHVGVDGIGPVLLARNGHSCLSDIHWDTVLGAALDHLIHAGGVNGVLQV